MLMNTTLVDTTTYQYTCWEMVVVKQSTIINVISLTKRTYCISRRIM